MIVVCHLHLNLTAACRAARNYVAAVSHLAFSRVSVSLIFAVTYKYYFIYVFFLYFDCNLERSTLIGCILCSQNAYFE